MACLCYCYRFRVYLCIVVNNNTFLHSFVVNTFKSHGVDTVQFAPERLARMSENLIEQ